MKIATLQKVITHINHQLSRQQTVELHQETEKKRQLLKKMRHAKHYQMSPENLRKIVTSSQVQLSPEELLEFFPCPPEQQS